MDLNGLDTVLLLAVLFAISFGALVKGMTGLGLPLFAVPALAAITSVENAVVLMIIPGIGANLWLVVNLRRFGYQLRDHVPFLVAGFAGGIAGTFLLVVVSEQWLKLFLATWLATYLAQYFLAGNSVGIFRGEGGTAWPLGFAAGTSQGTMGISAQLVAPYYHGRSLEPQAYAFLVASTFLIFSLAQIIAVSNTELLTPARLQLSLIALVPTLVFTRVGIALAGRIPQLWFNRLLLVTFIVMELKLIYDVF